eukprot:TRINITY_DN757_c0_g1_i2.p1 TRINITY_DN757_c0_g1~~TRINITY_DN757_c0_g1_i2.p1  ORF type:complete len:103 (-),score=4.72 TRINITY_DN757_c0_g1_i2:48-356(-)
MKDSHNNRTPFDLLPHSSLSTRMVLELHFTQGAPRLFLLVTVFGATRVAHNYGHSTVSTTPLSCIDIFELLADTTVRRFKAATFQCISYAVFCLKKKKKTNR